MGTGQMFLVLMAVVLFSTIILTTQNNLFTLAYSSYEAMIMMQGYKIADRFLQEIEAMNISGSKSIEDIHDQYSFADSMLRINMIDYYVTSTTQWCDRSGGSPTDSLHNYLRIDVRIDGILGNDTIFIGHDTNPISYIYGKMGM